MNGKQAKRLRRVAKSRINIDTFYHWIQNMYGFKRLVLGKCTRRTYKMWKILYKRGMKND